MNEQEAKSIKQGDIVGFCAVPCRVMSIKRKDIAAPLFRLQVAYVAAREAGLSERDIDTVEYDLSKGSLVSYRLCSTVERMDEHRRLVRGA